MPASLVRILPSQHPSRTGAVHPGANSHDSDISPDLYGQAGIRCAPRQPDATVAAQTRATVPGLCVTARRMLLSDPSSVR
jgi:hypothetical protein